MLRKEKWEKRIVQGFTYKARILQGFREQAPNLLDERLPSCPPPLPPPSLSNSVTRAMRLTALRYQPLVFSPKAKESRSPPIQLYEKRRNGRQSPFKRYIIRQPFPSRLRVTSIAQAPASKAIPRPTDRDPGQGASYQRPKRRLNRIPPEQEQRDGIWDAQLVALFAPYNMIFIEYHIFHPLPSSSVPWRPSYPLPRLSSPLLPHASFALSSPWSPSGTLSSRTSWKELAVPACAMPKDKGTVTSLGIPALVISDASQQELEGESRTSRRFVHAPQTHPQRECPLSLPGSSLTVIPENVTLEQVQGKGLIDVAQAGSKDRS
ncbi:hypothetical protein NMY22_g5308 [Coprinellus aureogranulatus]|nr:hypothetical protein NMY22_g5308 [Coprinellus aureogranulatus]